MTKWVLGTLKSYIRLLKFKLRKVLLMVVLLGSGADCSRAPVREIGWLGGVLEVWLRLVVLLVLLLRAMIGEVGELWSFWSFAKNLMLTFNMPMWWRKTLLNRHARLYRIELIIDQWIAILSFHQLIPDGLVLGLSLPTCLLNVHFAELVLQLIIDVSILNFCDLVLNLSVDSVIRVCLWVVKHGVQLFVGAVIPLFLYLGFFKVNFKFGHGSLDLLQLSTCLALLLVDELAYIDYFVFKVLQGLITRFKCFIIRVQGLFQ
jgi:hypothetical protein